MTVALDIISSALRLIGVVASGETTDVSTANDSLTVFQQMIDSWNADRLSIFTTSSNDFPLMQGKQSYTLGSGGDFSMTRPARIESMSAILLNNPVNPIEQQINYTDSPGDWQAIPVKNVTGTFPLICYDDGGYPNRTLNFWPIPNSGINSIRIYSWQALSSPAALTTAIAFPPGYAEAFRYNLAIRLSAEFSMPVTPTVAQIASESLARVKSMNLPDMSVNSDLDTDTVGSAVAFMFGLPYRGPLN